MTGHANLFVDTIIRRARFLSSLFLWSRLDIFTMRIIVTNIIFQCSLLQLYFHMCSKITKSYFYILRSQPVGVITF